MNARYAKSAYVGDGAMRPQVEAAARELPGLVRYVGRLPYAEVASVAAHALLSFVFVTSVVAMTINIVAQLFTG